MNRAVTKGHESDVGKKTTHHFMYPESAKDLEPNVHLVLVPFKPHDLLWFANVLTNKNFFLCVGVPQVPSFSALFQVKRVLLAANCIPHSVTQTVNPSLVFLLSRTHRKLKGHITADSNKVIIFHPGFFKYVHDEWTEHHGRYPSTGMLALIFGLHICDQ
eukprot:g32937.t1